MLYIAYLFLLCAIQLEEYDIQYSTLPRLWAALPATPSIVCHKSEPSWDWDPLPSHPPSSCHLCAIYWCPNFPVPKYLLVFDRAIVGLLVRLLFHYIYLYNLRLQKQGYQILVSSSGQLLRYQIKDSFTGYILINENLARLSLVKLPVFPLVGVINKCGDGYNSTLLECKGFTEKLNMTDKCMVAVVPKEYIHRWGCH